MYYALLCCVHIINDLFQISNIINYYLKIDLIDIEVSNDVLIKEK